MIQPSNHHMLKLQRYIGSCSLHASTTVKQSSSTLYSCQAIIQYIVLLSNSHLVHCIAVKQSSSTLYSCLLDYYQTVIQYIVQLFNRLLSNSHLVHCIAVYQTTVKQSSSTLYSCQTVIQYIAQLSNSHLVHCIAVKQSTSTLYSCLLEDIGRLPIT